MNPIQALKSGFSQYVNFNGRARRSEYWWWTVAISVITVFLNGVGALTGLTIQTGSNSMISIPGTIFSLACFLPSLSVHIRRLHDIGKSGWWIFMSLVPCVGWIFMLIWNLTDSQYGDNQYGPCPK